MVIAFVLESGGSTENEKEIGAGKHTFPFSYQLPSNLPCSFEGKWGIVWNK